MTQRRALLKRYGIALALLAAYYLVVRFTSVSIPCPFKKITGLRCPGCGISRMLVAMSKGHFSEAFGYNQVLFFMVPMFVVLSVMKLAFMPKFLSDESKFYRIMTYAAIAVLLIFGVLRNIFKF